jgi:hypothetical protein
MTSSLFRPRAFSAVAMGLLVHAVAGVAPAQTLPQPAVKRLDRTAWTWNAWPVDLNRDGITDIVTRASVSGTMQVATARGLGNGSFAAFLATGRDAVPMGTGDFNNDGRMDVIVSGVAILEGRGDGTLGTAHPVSGEPSMEDVFHAYSTASDALSADFDGDGSRDVGIVTASGVDIYRGLGNFTFAAPVSLVTTEYAEKAIAADFDNDGRRDVAVAELFGRVSIFLNNGGMTFSLSTFSFARGYVLSLTSGDLNRDSRVDLIAVTSSDGGFAWEPGRVHVALGTGTGTFAPATEVVTGRRGSMTVVVGEFNGDAFPDVATGNRSWEYVDTCGPVFQYWDGVTILPGRGDGTFGTPSHVRFDTLPAGAPESRYVNTHTALKIADVDGDGRTDLIASPGIVVMLGPQGPNRLPTINAGPDVVFGADASDHEVVLDAGISEADFDWLSVVWTDDDGRVVARSPRWCTQAFETTTFTATVTDSRGGVSSDTTTAYVTTRDPAALVGRDIGAVAAAGSSSYNGTTFRISGSGSDVWGTRDELHFAWAAVLDNTRITARVTNVENLSVWTKAGLMIRESLDPGARQAFLIATPTTTKGIAFQRRPTTNGTSIHTSGPAIAAPVWLSLAIVNGVVSAYYRVTPSQPWTLVGRQAFTDWIGDGSGNFYIGFAMSSHVDGRVATATFDDISIERAADGWGTRDIGATGIPGATSDDGVVMSMDASGADVWGASDAFRYSYKFMDGDGTIVAHVRSVEHVAAWTKAGVMMRESVEPNSRHVFALVSPGKGVAMQYRPTPGGVSFSTGPRAGTAPEWIKLVRSGDTFISSVSEDGVTWTEMGRVTVPMSSGLLVGLALNGHSNSTLATATFTDVSIEP